MTDLHGELVCGSDSLNGSSGDDFSRFYVGMVILRCEHSDGVQFLPGGCIVALAGKEYGVAYCAGESGLAGFGWLSTASALRISWVIWTLTSVLVLGHVVTVFVSCGGVVSFHAIIVWNTWSWRRCPEGVSAGFSRCDYMLYVEFLGDITDCLHRWCRQYSCRSMLLPIL